MREHKRLLTAVFGLWIVLLIGLFLVVRPELAYSYGHWLHGAAGNLPRLTNVLSLPVLGPDISTSRQDHGLVFWAVWAYLFIPPILLLCRCWRAVDPDALTSVLMWTVIYALLALILGIGVVFGLWLPFSAA